MFEILIYIFKGIFQLLMWTWWIIVPIVAIVAFQNFRKSKWVENLESVVLWVKIPKNSEKGPTSAEMMFASLHSILRPAQDLKKEGSIQEHISFEMVADAKSIMFYVWTPKHLQNFVEGQVYAQYPTAEISVVDDYSKNVSLDPTGTDVNTDPTSTGIDIDHDGIDDCVAGCELKLIKPDYFPIKTFVSFEVDPLAGITGALSKIEGHSEKMWIQILTRPASDAWRNKGLAYAEGLKGGSGPNPFSKNGIKSGLFQMPGLILSTVFDVIFPTDEKGGKSAGSTKQITHNEETSLACLEEKANKLGYQVKIRILYIAKSKEIAKQNLRITTGAFKQFNTTLANGFAVTKTRTGKDVLEEYRARLFTDKGFILNIEEVASLYHLPHASVETPNIVWTSSKKGEPPANLPYADDPNIDQNDITVFAETTFRGQLRKFGIKKDDRRRHMYVLGKSGTGKSKMLELLAVEDIKRGEGVGIVDPHGELIHDILKQIPENRIEDVVYINPADKDHPVGFNPMKATPDLREGVASGFVSVFKKQFGYSWGPRLEYLMRYAILALTYYPDTTMLDVVKILTDKDFRKKVLTYVEDPVVKTFWLKEFSTYNDKFATEAVAPILNKVGQFTASPTIRNIIGQTKETFDFEDAMNTQKIILVDLASGKIGEDNSELLGSLMITKMQLSAMARAKIKPEDRKDFFLYVDEFQNFATEAFAKILSEARKYRLALILTNQYVAQMDETVRDAVFGNIGTLMAFRVGATDASFLEKEFSPTFEKDDLIGLDNRHIYLNMLIDGVASNSFSAKSLFVKEGDEGNTEKIIARSREKYSRPRAEIEEQIKKWSNVDAFDIDKTVDRQNESKFDGNDYVRNTANKEGSRSHTGKIETPQGATDKPKKYDHPTNSYKKTTSYPAISQTNQKQSRSEEAVPIKKSVDPEELKKIIQKLTQPTSEKKSEETDTIAKENIKPLPTVKPLTVATEKGADNAVQSLNENKKTETTQVPSAGLTNIQDVSKLNKANTNQTPIKLVKIQDTSNLNPVSPAQTNLGNTEKVEDKLSKNDLVPENTKGENEKPAIKITKITGGAEIERVEIKQPTITPTPIVQPRPRIVSEQAGKAAVNPVPTINQSQPSRTLNPISQINTTNQFIKKMADIEEENIRRITREEFLSLKEIQPNEKIVIINKKEGESTVNVNREEGSTSAQTNADANPPTSPSRPQS